MRTTPPPFLLIVLVAFFVSASTIPVCEDLQREISDAITLPSDANYTSLSQDNWAATAHNTPACIATPSTTSQLQIITSRLASQHVSFAIRGGGHAVAPNASNIAAHGVLIDMRNFNGIVYDEEKSVIRVESGLRWGGVYRVLTPLNVTVVGGRNVDVGVAGLALGGGLAYVTDKYGMVCDNIVNYELLLGNGSVVNANASSSPDLFRALKGGGNNLGILTSMTMKVYPQGAVWAGYRLYAREHLPALVSAMAAYQAMPDKDPEANMMIQAPATYNPDIGGVLNFIHGRGEKDSKAFAPFSGIPFTVDTIRERTLEDFIADQIMVDPKQVPRWDFRITAFRLNASNYMDVLNTIYDAPELQILSNISLGALNIGWQPISGAVAVKGRESGGNVLGLAPEPQSWLSLNTGWLRKEDDETTYAVSRDIAARIEEVTKTAETFLGYQFMNDASWDQPVIERYGEGNVGFLKAVHERYDPGNVFQNLVTGGWKLPK